MPSIQRPQNNGRLVSWLTGPPAETVRRFTVPRKGRRTPLSGQFSPLVFLALVIVGPKSEGLVLTCNMSGPFSPIQPISFDTIGKCNYHRRVSFKWSIHTRSLRTKPRDVCGCHALLLLFHTWIAHHPSLALLNRSAWVSVMRMFVVDTDQSGYLRCMQVNHSAVTIACC